jgi:hypothetical protein
MGSSRWSVASAAIVLCVGVTSAAAQKADEDLYAKPQPKNRPAPLVGLTETQRIEPATGLIDLAIAADGAGLLAYVVADAASHAEIHVLDTATGEDLRTVDISTLTTAPQRLWFVGRGKDAPILVVGPRATADDGETSSDVEAWVLDPRAKASKKGPPHFGPAEAIVLATRKGKPFVAVRTVKIGRKGTVYAFTRYDPKKGKKLGKPRTLTMIGGRDAKLGFTFHHWTGDGMVAVGIKEGDLDEHQDVRVPDSEARFDGLDPAQKKLAITAIADPMDHARRWETLESAGGPALFVRVGAGLDGLDLWRDDHPVRLALDQTWELYDPSTLSYGVDDDGTVWLGLAIDPWNRPAVARKKADPDYFDVFRVDGERATRVGRVLAPKGRFAVGATAGRVWLLERNVGFDRGGKALTFYTSGETPAPAVD